jgi:hypothetical protein
MSRPWKVALGLRMPSEPEQRRIERPAARRERADDRGEQPVVGRQEAVARGLDDRDVALGAHARIDDGDVHGAAGK